MRGVHVDSMVWCVFTQWYDCKSGQCAGLSEVKTSTDKIVDTFMNLDLDESEAVSFEEYKTMVDLRALTRFEEMDANGDGEVTDVEYRKFWRENKAKWYRLQR